MPDSLTPPVSLARPLDKQPVVVGQSPRFQRLLRLIERVAPTDRALLVWGLTGSGKEVIAQLVHQTSLAANEPFLDVNCGAIPEHLVEAEFFGHAKGAFTGAQQARAGHFELVGKGTLFLDEIGELPLALQPKLLRVLETRRFRPIGSHEVRHFEGRIVAATHRDLQTLVREGKFREDLYYRLAVFVLEVPGLDQRQEDIAPLVSHFSQRQPRPLSFTLDALNYLRQFPWTGHVRQLRNLIDRLGILAESTTINIEILQHFLAQPAAISSNHEAVVNALLQLPESNKLAAAESLLIDHALAQCEGNKTAAARLLGVHRKVIERRLQAREDQHLVAQQCLLTGRQFVESSDFQAAIPHLQRGLDRLQRVSVQQDTRALRFELHRLLGVSYRSIQGWLSQTAVECYEAALEVGRELESEREITSLLFGIWVTQLMRLDLGKARQHAQAMLQHAQRSADPSISEEAHIAMANTLFWLGDSEETLACLNRSGLIPVSGEQRLGKQGLQGFDLSALAVTFEGLAAFQLGFFTRAKAAQRHLAQRGENADELPFSRAIALQGATWLACLFMDVVVLEPLAVLLEQLSRSHGFVFYQGIGEFFRGYCLLQHGQFAAAEQAMIAGYQDYMVRHGGKVFHSFQAWKRCEVLCAAQQWAAAEVLLDEALELSLEQQERAYLAELMVIKACIQQGKGKQQEAEQGLRSALATALALGSVPARLQAAWALAQLLSAQGRDVEALDVARRAIRGVEFETPYPVLQAIVAWLSQPLE